MPLIFKPINDNDIVDGLPQCMERLIQTDDQQGYANFLLTLIRYTLDVAILNLFYKQLDSI